MGLVVSLALIEHRMSRHAEQAWRKTFEAIVEPPRGSPFSVCEGTMTKRCAERAARQAGLPVAWFAPDGFRLEQMSAMPVDGSSSTELAAFTTSGLPMLLLLRSESEPQLPAGEAVEQLRIDGTRVELALGEIDGVLGDVTLRWRHSGVSHSLGLHSLGPDALDRDETIERLRSLFREVRYAEPRG